MAQRRGTSSASLMTWEDSSSALRSSVKNCIGLPVLVPDNSRVSYLSFLLFLGLTTLFFSFNLVLSLVKTILCFLGFYFLVLSLDIIEIRPRVSCSLFKGFF